MIEKDKQLLYSIWPIIIHVLGKQTALLPVLNNVYLLQNTSQRKTDHTFTQELENSMKKMILR